jgi:hypothetical protein
MVGAPWFTIVVSTNVERIIGTLQQVVTKHPPGSPFIKGGGGWIIVLVEKENITWNDVCIK